MKTSSVRFSGVVLVLAAGIVPVLPATSLGQCVPTFPLGSDWKYLDEGTSPDCDDPAGPWHFPVNYVLAGLCESQPGQLQVVPTNSFDPGAAGRSLALNVGPDPNLNIHMYTLFPRIDQTPGARVSVTFDLWVPSGGAGCSIYVGGDHGGGGFSNATDRGPQISWDLDGRITARTPAGNVVLVPAYLRDAWQTVCLTIDLSTDTFDASYGPRGGPLLPVGAAIPFRAPSGLHHLDRFTIAHFGGAAPFASAYLNNFEMGVSAPCYADCDRASGAGTLDIFDFLCFQNRFDAGDPYACDCDTGTGPGVCDVFDFLCFQNAYGAGCEPTVLSAQFNQVNLNVDNREVPRSDWGRVDVAFTGRPEVMYFNLAFDGPGAGWVVQNVPVLSIRGAGVPQEMSISFPLGNAPGVRVRTLPNVFYGLSLEPISAPDTSSRGVQVGEKDVVMDSGIDGESLPLTRAEPSVWAQITGDAAINVTTFNQECENQYGCVPTAISNSLKMLQANGLDISDADITQANMKNVLGFIPGVGTYWPDWLIQKTHWGEAHGIETRTTANPDEAMAAVDRYCDVELRAPGHVAVVSGMIRGDDGSWTVWVGHDLRQAETGGMVSEPVKYDPKTGDIRGPYWSGGPARFVIECPR